MSRPLPPVQIVALKPGSRFQHAWVIRPGYVYLRAGCGANTSARSENLVLNTSAPVCIRCTEKFGPVLIKRSRSREAIQPSRTPASKSLSLPDGAVRVEQPVLRRSWWRRFFWWV